MAMIRKPKNEPTAIPVIVDFESPSSNDVGVDNEVEKEMLVVLCMFIELDNVDKAISLKKM